MATQLAGFELEHPLMNGAGVCKTVDDVADLARSCLAAVVVGSITVASRAGNPGQTYWECADYSINSLGLPNLGIKYYSESLPEMAGIVHDMGKVLIVSVAGSEIDEYVELTTQAVRCGADLVELNLGCPNVWDGGLQKRIPCFDPEYSGRLCRRVAESLRLLARDGGPTGSFGMKISPFSDPFALERLAIILGESARECPEFKFITATNAFPNALIVDHDGKPRIDMELGGLGGHAIKPIVLGHIKQLRKLLPESVDLIGIGGVASGEDMAEYLAVGATCVQATTAFAGSRNPGVFAKILSEYVNCR